MPAVIAPGPASTTTVAATVAPSAGPMELPVPSYALVVPLGTAAAAVKLPCPAATKQTRIDDEIACRRFDPAAKGAIPPKVGPTVRFHPNGAIASQGSYVENERDGVWIDWDDAGHRIAVKTWKAGAQQGLSITWWSNGKRQSQIEFEDGKIHGTSTTWGDDGKPLATKRYDHGKVVETIGFDADGKPRKI